jgi:DNA-binding IclR family transcriptional regulator
VVIGSIGISAPVLRFTDDRYREFTDQVRTVAREISAALRTDLSTK